MGLQVTTTGATSIKVGGENGYVLRRKRWTPLRNPDDAWRILGPTPNAPIVRTDRELAPYYVTLVGAEPKKIQVHYDWETRTRRMQPGDWEAVDRVAFLYLIRQINRVRAVTAHELLKVKPNANIVIQRMGGIGDLMFLTAALRALKEAHPRARLSLATAVRSKWVMAQTGLFETVEDFVSIYDRAPFDMDVDLRNWVEAHPGQYAVNRMELFAKGLGLSCGGDYRMALNAPQGECPELEGVEHPLAIDLTGSSWQRGPSFSHALAVVNAVVADGWTPVNIRLRPVPWWPKGLGVTGLTSPQQQLRVLSRCAVLAVDTGTLHLANALGRPSVGLFGPVPGKLRVAGQPNCTVLESPSPCRDCYVHQRKCTASTRAKCFDDIKPATIVAALRSKREHQRQDPELADAAEGPGSLA